MRHFHSLVAADSVKANNALCVEGCLALTLIPVLVAFRTASTKGSYFGLKCTVHAQSIMRPGLCNMRIIGKLDIRYISKQEQLQRIQKIPVKRYKKEQFS
jgi:hypothetical protein